MPLQKSNSDNFSGVALRFGLTSPDVQEHDYRDSVSGSPFFHCLVDKVDKQTAPAGPCGRSGSFPNASYPFGGWYVRTKVNDPRGGSLAGNQIAIKEDIAAAADEARKHFDEAT